MSMDLEEQYDKIYRYCYFKTHSQYIAEDVTQETFLRYFRQTTYINRGKPLAYLYTIAKNICNDYFTKRVTEPLEEDTLMEDKEDDLITSIVLKQSLKALPEDMQELILLRYVNELSVGEICNIVGLSRFAVYRKINSGLKELKTLLREEDF
ncbi:MAG: polymerase, sigma-24 subunit, subfamily [Herbinix sp.]|nr:polymerase, sigma-24 subunit, subfamily [Herbinix sp.]